MPPEWQTLARLTGIVSGQGPDVDVDAVDSMVIGAMVAREVGDEHSRIGGRDAGEIMAELEPRRGPERMLDLLLRVGAYGDAFGDDPGGLTLARLEENPHGIDLGPLEPRVPERAAHGLGPDRAGARADRGRPAAPARVAGRQPPRRWCWSAGASCARTTRGCTTWSRW